MMNEGRRETKESRGEREKKDGCRERERELEITKKMATLKRRERTEEEEREDGGRAQIKQGC